MSKNKLIFALAYAYLTVPFMIFLFGWLRLIYALPLAIALGYAYWLMVKHAPEVDLRAFYAKSPMRFFIAIAIILLWVAYSGAGGFFYQNPDFMGRNGMFDALVNRPWPSADLYPANFDFPVGLVYYFLTWLPAVLVSRAFGWAAGTITLGIWLALGIWLTYVIIANKFAKKSALWILLVFVFFSGLDSVGIWLTGRSLHDPFFAGFCPIRRYPHIEWWNSFQLSSNTTQLFWVFNQAVPAWLATVMVMEQRRNRSLGMILALLPLAALIPVFGLFVIAVYKIFENAKGMKKREFWRDLISFENVLCLFIVTVAILFVDSNVRGNEGFNWTAFRGWHEEGRWLLGLGLEALVWFAICFRHQRKNPLFYLCIASLFVLTRIRIGNEPDFAMRSTIPIMFILMIFVIQSVNEFWKKRQFIAISLAGIIFVLGAITPFMEIGRSVSGTARAYRYGWSPETWDSHNIFEGFKYENYAGKLDTFFWQNLARPTIDGGAER